MIALLAFATLLGATPFTVRAPEGDAYPDAEVWTASDRAPKAPPEQAARRRRAPSAPGTGALPAAVVGAIGAPAILIVRGTILVATRPGDCVHCTRAARPPPTR